MRVPLSWLRDYVDFDLPPERLAERLTTLGMEVQSIDKIGADWSSIVVGELLEVVPHPNADRLSLTKVRVSETDAPLSIVCGATNIAVGQRVPVALPGAVLPGGRQIGVSTIQGSESRGMLCSGVELGLTSDADGILILSEAGGADAPQLGTPVEDVVGDVVLDIDVKPNRGDALSLIGLAREVAAISGTSVRWPPIEVPESGDSTNDHVWVEVADKRLCPRFVARYVDGLKIGPSPVRVQLRLAAAGMRPVSNAVDASNYVMLEMGKPIHVFDAASVSGGTIVVRPARDGERLETLDHVQRTLNPETLVIADAGGAIGIAGVMGGADSEVSSTTTAAIVESAIFDPVSIRRTAFRYGLRSEASLRFEKGQESRLARLGADRTAQLLANWAGGRPAVGVLDTNPQEEQPRRVVFRPTRVNRLLGATLDVTEMREALRQIDIQTDAPGADDRLRIVSTETLPIEVSEQAVVAIVPPHRRDIEIEADVAEEICRLLGYDKVPAKLPDTAPPKYRADPLRVVNFIRDMAAGRGLSEVVTNALIGPADHAAIGYFAEEPNTIRVENPVTVEHSELRQSLVPGLVGVVGRNERRHRRDAAIFEIGATYFLDDNRSPRQRYDLAILLAGDWRSQSWSEPARPASVDDLKGLIEAIASRLSIGQLRYQPPMTLHPFEHPGRTAEVYAELNHERPFGRVGELHPRYLARYDIRGEHVSFATLSVVSSDAMRPSLTSLSAAAGVPEVREIDRLPSVERDLAVVVDRGVAAADVAGVIRAHAGPFLTTLSLFDRYQGPPLEESQVSLAYRLRFQPPDTAVGESVIDAAVASVTDALARDVKGRVRTGS